MVLCLRTNPGASKWDQIRFAWFILQHHQGVLGEVQPSLSLLEVTGSRARIPEPAGWALAGPNKNLDVELAGRPSDAAIHTGKALAKALLG